MVTVNLDGARHNIPVMLEEMNKEKLIYHTMPSGEQVVINVSCNVIPETPMYRDKVWLHEGYVVKARTIQSIASQFGLTPMSIHGWLKKLEIPTRSRGRRKGL